MAPHATGLVGSPVRGGCRCAVSVQFCLMSYVRMRSDRYELTFLTRTENAALCRGAPPASSWICSTGSMNVKEKGQCPGAFPVEGLVRWYRLSVWATRVARRGTTTVE